MKIYPNTERNLWLLMIHSELACQNDAIQEFRHLLKVPKRYTKFRYEKLYRMADSVYPHKNYVKDWEWFEECSDLQWINCKDELIDTADIYKYIRNMERSGVNTMWNIHPVTLAGLATKETKIQWGKNETR